MIKALLALPVAIAGAALLVLGESALLWAPLLVIGIAGVLAPSVVGARHDDAVRAEATGVGATQRGPGDPGRRGV